MPDMAVVCLNKLISLNMDIAAVVLPDKTNVSRESIANIAKKANINIIEYQNTPNEPEFINKVKEELYRHASDRNKINYYYLNSNE